MACKAWRSGAGAAVFWAAAISSIGCQKEEPRGELVGVYAIAGRLTENTCGQAGLKTLDPLSFQAEIRDDQGIGYWRLAKKPAFAGELAQDGAFRFAAEQNTLVSGGRRPKQNLEPSDFYSGEPDPDLDTTTCTLLYRETISGTLHRTIHTLDGGVPDAGSPDAVADLEGDNTIEISAVAGSDCSTQLAVAGGGFSVLPCRAHYSLAGELQADLLQPR